MRAIPLPFSPLLLQGKGLDRGLTLALLALVSIGLVMVASSSIDFASARYHDPWFMLKKQLVFLLIGLTSGCFVALIPMQIWQKYSAVFLLVAVGLLIVVLIPGIGKVVNGSRRWLPMGFASIQASEVVKLCMILFFASFLTRRSQAVRGQWAAFFVMVFVIGLIVVLLLLEPDFGSAVVMCFTLGTMMFVAGVPILRFILLALVGAFSFSAMAVLSPYRWERLIAFMDPWARQFDSGYQLVQSLIAFGRGEWLGLGLGNSIQKLFFLPEAHTDFIFSIIAEEFGLVGALGVILLFAYFITKIFLVAKQAYEKEQLFSAYLCFGIGIMLAIQAFINMGVASGLLPTKGLTLPFISYGGSSLLVSSALIALVFRANWELSDEPK